MQGGLLVFRKASSPWPLVQVVDSARHSPGAALRLQQQAYAQRREGPHVRWDGIGGTCSRSGVFGRRGIVLDVECGGRGIGIGHADACGVAGSGVCTGGHRRHLLVECVFDLAVENGFEELRLMCGELCRWLGGSNLLTGGILLGVRANGTMGVEIVQGRRRTLEPQRLRKWRHRRRP